MSSGDAAYFSQTTSGCVELARLDAGVDAHGDQALDGAGQLGGGRDQDRHDFGAGSRRAAPQPPTPAVGPSGSSTGSSPPPGRRSTRTTLEGSRPATKAKKRWRKRRGTGPV